MSADADEQGSGEDRLIARYFKPLATHPAALGLVDDTAVWAPPAGHDLVLKADAIVGGVHFLADDPADTVARKALRVNLSDLAAKGAKPAGFLLSLALPEGLGEAWLETFARGLGQDADRFGCPLFGGDTVRSPQAVMVSIAVFGSVPAGTMVRRGGARDGDLVFVTGTIGDAHLGLRLRRDAGDCAHWHLRAPMQEHLIARYLLPQPRSALAEVIRTHATASVDVSDGLVGDLGKLCRASGLSAVVEAARVPLSEAARSVLSAEPGLLEPILTGGDDFEVVVTVPLERVTSFRAAALEAGVAVHEIGRMIAGQDAPQVVAPDGRRLAFARTSFSHF